MSIGSILKKALKAGYYIVSYEGMYYAFSESEALVMIDALDRKGQDTAVYRYRDGVFYRCRVVDLEKFSLNNKNSN